jgi:DNA replicative helicase MCM subunit Mcm2 (Cdc46/Mcm family)
MRRDARVHGAGGDVLTTDFLRKYIIHARRRYAKLSAPGSEARIDIEDDALNAIIDYYGDLRAKSYQDRALPVTARTLECILRIATAMCKVRPPSLIGSPLALP